VGERERINAKLNRFNFRFEQQCKFPFAESINNRRELKFAPADTKPSVLGTKNIWIPNYLIKLKYQAIVELRGKLADPFP
jgi:hypothetical protein